MIKLRFLSIFIFLSTLFAQAQTYKLEENISYRPEATDDYMKERCKLDVYYPEGETDFATIVWIHGGGLKGGSKHIPEELKNQGMAVVTINYRLAPKVEAPAFIDDAAAAISWTFEHINQYGGDKSKIFVTGHSAGGYLVHMVALDKQYLAKYGIDADQVKGYLPLSGQTMTHFTIREAMGLEQSRIIADKYAPVFYPRAEAPPMVLITGDRNLEMTARYEENAMLYSILKGAGHQDVSLYELQGFDHVTMVSPACRLVVTHVRRMLEE